MSNKSKDRKEEYKKNCPNVLWDKSSTFIKNSVDTLIATSTKTIDSFSSLRDDDKCYETVVEKLAFAESELEKRKNILAILISSATHEELIGSYNDLVEFTAELAYRKDLFEILNMIKLNEKSLPSECNLYLSRSLLRMKRNGLHLPKEQRVQIKNIDADIMKYCNEYKRLIIEAEQIPVKFDFNQLEGMSRDFIMGLDHINNKYMVRLQPRHVVPILRYCAVASTRQTIEMKYNSKCSDSNVKILENVLKLRHQRAQILGYQTYVDFVTESLMSKSADNVFDFLISLSGMLAESFKKERKRLLNLKKRECRERGMTFDQIIRPYDLEYYKRMVEEEDFSIDENLIREYFPTKHVTEQMLLVYKKLFGVCFHRIRGTPTWHRKVKLYSVCEEVSDKLLGYFYLDLYMRPGKNNYVASFPIQCALTGNASYSVAQAALIANFSKPEYQNPSTLTHDQVVSYFHEFGHLMHQITCKVRYTIFDGLSTERDFVEAPSQMVENLAWDHEIIKMLSCHYKTNEKMSAELITNLCVSRKANSSLYLTGQIMLSVFDFKIHTSSKINLSDVYKQCSEIFMSITPTPGTNFAASFRHACSGYEAQYYGYLWSEIIACDIYLSYLKFLGITKSKTGSKYRKYIIEPGSTRSGGELFQNLMDRGPIVEPFLKTYGILS